MELRGKIKSAKAQLAELDESAIGEVGTSKKSKKTQEAAVVNDQGPQHCKPKLRLTSVQPKKPQEKPKTGLKWLPMTCSSCTQICCPLMPNTLGTKLYTSRPHQTHIQTYKAVLRKDPGDFHASRLTIARCSTFSLCSPTMQLSRSGTTSQTC